MEKKKERRRQRKRQGGGGEERRRLQQEPWPLLTDEPTHRICARGVRGDPPGRRRGRVVEGVY